MSAAEEPLHRQLALTDDEFDEIVSTLGREPNRAELAMYAAMWSEHCSYKSSKVHLRSLPSEGPRVLVGPGQDAGAIDIGDGLAVVFKIESHSHPSAVEPYRAPRPASAASSGTSSRWARGRSRCSTRCGSDR
jgi:phosphoribosylformylglycinamidine (FGAM) synthase-like enzyme